MKINNFVKLFLDIIIAIFFILMFNKNIFTGMSFHEIAGIGIGIALLTHLALNLNWIENTTAHLFSKKIALRTKFCYFLNFLLLLSAAVLIICGILISKVVFPNLNIGNHAWLKVAHLSFAYLTLLILGIHIGMHWPWLANHLKKIFAVKSSAATNILAKSLVLIILIFGCFQIYSTNYFSKLEGLGTVIGISSSNTSIQKTPPSGFTRETSPPPNHSSEGFDKRSDQNASVLRTIASYSSIIGVFAIPTYYLEKFFRKNRSPKSFVP
jgi:hypothetical protein